MKKETFNLAALVISSGCIVYDVVLFGSKRQKQICTKPSE